MKRITSIILTILVLVSIFGIFMFGISIWEYSSSLSFSLKLPKSLISWIALEDAPISILLPSNSTTCNVLLLPNWVVEITETNAEGKRVQKGLEIDFIATKGNNKYYIQSAFDMPTVEKEQQEKKYHYTYYSIIVHFLSLVNIFNSFRQNLFEILRN